MRSAVTLTIVALLLSPRGAAAIGFPLPSNLTALTNQLSNAMVKTIGLSTDHRPMEPATALGTFLGLELGLELTLAKPPSDINEALSAAGMGSSSVSLAIIPVPKLHVKKGITDRLGAGISGIFYLGYALYGGDLKYTVSQPEEGPTWAVRLAYSEADIGYVESRTLSPQLLVSRALEFADPYLGIGYQLTRGKLQYSQTIGPITVPLTGVGEGQAFIAFTGVQFRVKPLGFQITLEGAYSSADIHTLATRVGFRF